MDVLEAIHSRRSIRKFEEKDVSEQDVKELLEAAMMAPSAINAQPWQFIVVRDREILDKVPSVNQYAAMAAKSPVSILVCGDLSKEKYPGYWVQDCSAAVQNLLLAAHGKGLGAVWTGIYPMEERINGFNELFKLPEHVMPLALVVVGHPAQQPKSTSRYNEERVHRNTWEG